MNFRVVVLHCCFIFMSSGAFAESFKVEDIRVEGLQRIPLERVFGLLPVSVGDQVDSKRLSLALKELFNAGDFNDIEFGRDGDVLILKVAERPAINSIDIAGNKSIDKDVLLTGLSDAGLSKGEVLRRSTLEGIEGELQRQYVAQGRYGAIVKTKLTPLPRNRVDMEITIKEGKVSKIEQINIIGNSVFDDKELLDLFQLKKTTMWSLFKGNNKYARERLSGDLETLRSYYLDRGYIKSSIDSTQVSVSEDKKKVFINMNIVEGEKYTINEVTLAGTMVVDEALLKPLVVVKKGQTFSQQLLTFTSDIISRRLGNEGYTFASVNSLPDVNEEDKTVDITFFINPGKRIYVNKIHFQGNVKTADEVLRREMRQFEGAPASSTDIEVGRLRLQRLGFFSSVKMETELIPGFEDMVDVFYTVEEQPSGSISANVGYSENGGFTFGANISQSNFMGTGNRVSFGINQSKTRDSYNFSFLDPYFTDDGVSRGYNVFFTKTDTGETAISNYITDRAGGSISFGYPINEYERLNFGFGADNTEVTIGNSVAKDIGEFLEEEGNEFNTFSVTMGWSRSTLNGGIKANRGARQNLGLEIAIPGSDVTYFKVNYDAEKYFPFGSNWALRFKSTLGFGNGYGDSSKLPFYKNYFAGGFGSVRGYESSSLGPTSQSSTFHQLGADDPDPGPIGGNLKVEGSTELIFPVPFVKDDRNIKTAFYLDGGNVFQTEGLIAPAQSLETITDEFDFAVEDFRYSVGVGLSWYTVVGPLSFTLSHPIKDQEGDDTRTFQFSLGQAF